MDPKGISKASARLQLATTQLNVAEAALSYREFSDAWYLFLVSLKGVYNYLEQGSKTNAQSRQWYGAKKQERKSDELLQYVFQARNDDEHGLDEITHHEPGSIGLGVAGPGYAQTVHLRDVVIENGKLIHADMRSIDGSPVLAHIRESKIHLQPVTGRGGIIYQPPNSHLGKPLEDNNPIAVGKLALAYFTTLIDDASKLPA